MKNGVRVCESGKKSARQLGRVHGADYSGLRWLNVLSVSFVVDDVKLQIIIIPACIANICIVYFTLFAERERLDSVRKQFAVGAVDGEDTFFG